MKNQYIPDDSITDPETTKEQRIRREHTHTFSISFLRNSPLIELLNSSFWVGKDTEYVATREYLSIATMGPNLQMAFQWSLNTDNKTTKEVYMGHINIPIMQERVSTLISWKWKGGI